MRINKILPFICLALCSAGAQTLEDATSPAPYLDLGVQGRVYDIVETDFLEDMKSEVAKYKKVLKKEQVNADIERQVEAAANRPTQLPFCKKDEDLGAVQDSFVSPVDIRNPLGRVVVKKGEVVNTTMPSGVKLEICYINYANEAAGENQLNSMVISHPRCLFLVANKDVRDLRKKYPNYEIYPTSTYQEQRFMLNCYPSILTMENNTLHIVNYNYDDFKTDLKDIK